jgi:hypothetical protein
MHKIKNVWTTALAIQIWQQLMAIFFVILDVSAANTFIPYNSCKNNYRVPTLHLVKQQVTTQMKIGVQNCQITWVSFLYLDMFRKEGKPSSRGETSQKDRGIFTSHMQKTCVLGVHIITMLPMQRRNVNINWQPWNWIKFRQSKPQNWGKFSIFRIWNAVKFILVWM